MKLQSLGLVIFGAVAAIADEHTHRTLQEIKAATNNFHQRLADWDGGYLGAVPVALHSRSLINTLNTAMSPRNNMIAARSPSTPEMERETIDMARQLAADIGQAVDTAIAARPMMEAIPVAGKRVGGMIFRGLHSASGELGKEFAPRASEEHQEEVQAILRDIDEHFMRGLAAFG
jgi:hypothetical protein